MGECGGARARRHHTADRTCTNRKQQRKNIAQQHWKAASHWNVEGCLARFKKTLYSYGQLLHKIYKIIDVHRLCESFKVLRLSRRPCSGMQARLLLIMG